jgi:hypothetical protein
MEMISVENHGKVVYAKLNHGVTNAMNRLIFQKSFPVLSLRSLAASSCGLKKDHHGATV